MESLLKEYPSFIGWQVSAIQLPRDEKEFAADFVERCPDSPRLCFSVV